MFHVLNLAKKDGIENSIRFHSSKNASGHLLLKEIEITVKPVWKEQCQERRPASVPDIDTNNQ